MFFSLHKDKFVSSFFQCQTYPRFGPFGAKNGSIIPTKPQNPETKTTGITAIVASNQEYVIQFGKLLKILCEIWLAFGVLLCDDMYDVFSCSYR